MRRLGRILLSQAKDLFMYVECQVNTHAYVQYYEMKKQKMNGWGGYKVAVVW